MFGLEARDTLFGQIYHLDRLLLGCSEDQERYVQAVKLARPHHTLTRNQRQEVCSSQDSGIQISLAEPNCAGTEQKKKNDNNYYDIVYGNHTFRKNYEEILIYWTK